MVDRLRRLGGGVVGELLEDGPRMRSLHNLHVLGEACALSASSGLPIEVAG